MNNTTITPPQGKRQEPKASSAEVVASEILQDNFASNADRDEFSQAIKMNGVTFLHLANAPLPQPSKRDLNMMRRLARSLACFWPQALVIGGSHE